jgi:hypothetical protein
MACYEEIGNRGSGCTLVLVSTLDRPPDAETLTDKTSKDAKPDYVIGRARGHKKHPSFVEPDPSRLNASGNYLTSKSLTTLRSQGLDPTPSGTSQPRFASTNYLLKDVVSAYEELQNLEFFLILYNASKRTRYQVKRVTRLIQTRTTPITDFHPRLMSKT